MDAILDPRLVESLGAWLDKLAQGLNNAPLEIAVPALLLPIVLAILSRRVFVILGSLLLTLIVLVMLIRPALFETAVVVMAYLGSLIVALAGILEFRRTRAIQLQLAELRQDVNQLQSTEARRYIVELKENKPTEDHT
jgi:hypothetical protein